MPSMVFTLKCNIVIFRSRFLWLGQLLETKVQQMSSTHLEEQGKALQRCHIELENEEEVTSFVERKLFFCD